jgi:hypothetical protein
VIVPTIKDRIVQQALRRVLEPIFEADFRPCSHGFRQGRSTHTALRDVARCYPSTSWIIEGVCGYHQIPEADLFAQVSMQYQGFCNYYKYATSPQSVFNRLAQETWWAVAHYLARRRKSSIKKMMAHAVRTGHHAKITKGDRTRGTFRQFVGNREVIVNPFPPTTREIRSLPNARDWRADLMPVRPMGWQGGRSLATRLEAIDRSNGIRERCHANPVDEVHHRVPLRRKRTRVARIESDASQRLTAIALCKQCQVNSHGRSVRSRRISSG